MSSSPLKKSPFFSQIHGKTIHPVEKSSKGQPSVIVYKGQPISKDLAISSYCLIKSEVVIG